MYFKGLKILLCKFLKLLKIHKFDGLNVIVQIDEILLVKNKNRKGRILSNQKWGFTGVVLENYDLCFFEHVEKR